tara:strand:+ start:186 stop:569 length:384 start_codon:yes stop_codon:yes gene_type:complete
MGNLKTELLTKLKGLAPFEQILALYKDKTPFFQELHNYMIGGLVISNPQYFMMAKPIKKSIDAHGQWFPEDADTWYIRWVAGQGCIKEMMDSLHPLPNLMFRRITPKGETNLRLYSWDKMYKIVTRK